MQYLIYGKFAFTNSKEEILLSPESSVLLIQDVKYCCSYLRQVGIKLQLDMKTGRWIERMKKDKKESIEGKINSICLQNLTGKTCGELGSLFHTGSKVRINLLKSLQKVLRLIKSTGLAPRQGAHVPPLHTIPPVTEFLLIFLSVTISTQLRWKISPTSEIY